MITCKEYLELSDAFEPSDDETFAVLVREAIQLTGMSLRDMGHEFEVMPSTISRWATGAVKPMPGMQRMTVAMLRRHITKIHTSTLNEETK